MNLIRKLSKVNFIKIHSCVLYYIYFIFLIYIKIFTT